MYEAAPRENKAGREGGMKLGGKANISKFRKGVLNGVRKRRNYVTIGQTEL